MACARRAVQLGTRTHRPARPFSHCRPHRAWQALSTPPTITLVVDLLGVDLDVVVSIERGRVTLYPGVPPSAGDNTTATRVMPPPGAGLNQPAMLTLRHMAVKQPNDAHVVAAFKRKLEEAAGRMGAIFVHYDPQEGVWLTKLDVWQ